MGEEAHRREELVVERKRGGPGIKWLLLLNPLISLRIIIVEPGGPRPVAKVVCFCVYGNMMSPVYKENEYVPSVDFCCCNAVPCGLAFFCCLLQVVFFNFYNENQ